MKDVFLIHIDIDHLIKIFGVFGNKILDRINVVIDVMFLAPHVTGKTPHPIIHDDDVRIKTMDQVIQGT